MPSTVLGPADALLIVDVQNDFFPGGALSVVDAGRVIAVLNEWIVAASRAGSLIIATRDWHPPDHLSFESQGGPWPPHCVQQTAGAAFCEGLRLPADAAIISKGTERDVEQYSPFERQELRVLLRERGIRRVWIGGVAQEYCVRGAVLDAIGAGFAVHVILEATAPVRKDDARRALDEMRAAGALFESDRAEQESTMSGPMPDGSSLHVALFTDLYELTMAQAFLRERMTDTAVFELYFRDLPPCRNFVVAAGLVPLLEKIENLQFSAEDIEYLRSEHRFSEEFLAHLSDFRFTGSIRAVPEGTIVFPNEPLVQVIAPLPQAQILETLIINQIQFASLAASKAARLILAGGGRRIIDYGSRRAQGMDAALAVARSAWLVGCDGTALVEAGRRDGISIFGTMAHSYIQSHDDEGAAFERFLESFPDSTLLIDTYDTIAGVRKVVELSRRLGDRFRAHAIRLDSGDIPSLARESRRMLDAAGLQRVQVFVSGGLDEYKLQQLTEDGAPIDAFGVGTALAVSEDVPTLDMVYKLVEYAGRPRTKLSSKKVLYPGRKQIYRHESGNMMTHDVLAPAGVQRPGMPLLTEVIQGGQRVGAGRFTLNESRAAFGRNFGNLPQPLRQLEQALPAYEVQVDAALQEEFERLRAAHRAGSNAK